MNRDNTKNMTEGNIISLIVRFMLPLLAGNLFQQCYNLADSAIVGQTLGASSLGAVGASSSVQFLVLGFCIGSCVGCAVPVAQRFGAGDYRGMRRYIWHGMLLLMIFGIVITLITAIFCPQILHLLSTPDDIFPQAYQYLLIIFLGIPFTLLYNYTSGILRAVGDSRTPFLFLSVSTVLNIFLDLFCILVLHWGVAGAAIATIGSQAVSGFLCLHYIIRKVEILQVRPEDRRFSSRLMKDLFTMGVPMGLQYSITAIGSMVMQSANNSLGTVYVSGFTAGMKIKQFAMCPFDALSTAVSTFAGQNYGAGKTDRIRRGIREGTAIGVLYGIGIGLILIFFGRSMSMIFVDGSEAAVLDASGKYLRCMGYFYWVPGILNVVRMSIQGLGYTGRAIISGIVEMVARCLVSFVFVPRFGYGAICWADQTAWICATCYVVPMLLYVLNKIEEHFAADAAAVERKIH